MSFPLPRLNPSARAAVLSVGHARTPVLIVDDLLDNARDAEDAARALSYRMPARTAYPGLNAPIDYDFAAGVLTLLRPALHAAFGIPAKAGLACDGYFGLACTPEAALQPSRPCRTSTRPSRRAWLCSITCADRSSAAPAFSAIGRPASSG